MNKTTTTNVRRAVAYVLAVWLCLVVGQAVAVTEPQGAYHVLVVGSEPEAITAAVAAAESGARTLLISEDERVGGLFVRGAMNVLDLRVTPVDYQRGLFERWWRAVGRGNAFDVARGERAFLDLLERAGVEVRLGAPPLAPLVHEGRVIGVTPAGESPIWADHVIDGSADAGLAAAAGARSTIGFAAIGLDARMVDTLVFQIDGVDWGALRQGARARGRSYAYVDDRVAYGHFAGHPAAFRASDPDIRLRGLNLGRQDDGSVLVNALLIYGLDPFDPASRADGLARAAAEVDAVIAWLALDVPGFAAARSGGVAEALYVRQTRHLVATCTLTVDHVLDSVVTDQDVAAGGYPLDVQTLRPSDDGFVFGLPDIYGARLCMSVPVDVDGVWVVGRSAGFDPIAQSSARVVPFGMALGEAVGVAAALGSALDMTPREVAHDPEVVRDVRESLASRGAYLPAVRPRRSVGPVGHPHYAEYRAMLRWGLAVGGYDNDPRLGVESSRTALVFLLSNVFQRAYHDEVTGQVLVARFGLDSGPLDAATAARITAAALCELERCPAGESWADLRASGLRVPEPSGNVRRGEAYALASLVLDGRRPGPDHAARRP
ncbi:MAG: FAD-dependent oxidoreductase [Trueperaceae bacterium]|nr:MAG: FAD-dependent oxidoreductase [Trueperaceae bacterium]